MKCSAKTHMHVMLHIAFDVVNVCEKGFHQKKIQTHSHILHLHIYSSYCSVPAQRNRVGRRMANSGDFAGYDRVEDLLSVRSILMAFRVTPAHLHSSRGKDRAGHSRA